VAAEAAATVAAIEAIASCRAAKISDRFAALAQEEVHLETHERHRPEVEGETDDERA
jgi:hypothetical protein